MHLLKCWIAGLAFSLIVVAGEAFALHTPFGFLAILFGIPRLHTECHRHRKPPVRAIASYMRCWLSSAASFMELLFYLISVLIRRISSKKPRDAFLIESASSPPPGKRN